jgi:hypothetical protein
MFYLKANLKTDGPTIKVVMLVLTGFNISNSNGYVASLPHMVWHNTHEMAQWSTIVCAYTIA